MLDEQRIKEAEKNFGMYMTDSMIEKLMNE